MVSAIIHRVDIMSGNSPRLIPNYKGGYISRKNNKKVWTVGIGDTKRKYYNLKINGMTLYLHRVLYSMFHKIPLKHLGIIDHIDGNCKNNAISNLRETTHSFNTLNCNVRITNTTGYKNISKDKNKFRFKIMYPKQFIKDFNTIEQAIHFRNNYYKSYPDVYFGTEQKMNCKK